MISARTTVTQAEGVMVTVAARPVCETYHQVTGNLQVPGRELPSSESSVAELPGGPWPAQCSDSRMGQLARDS